MKTSTSVRIAQEEYDAFHLLLKDEIPTTYVLWLERATKNDAQRVAQGYVINEVIVHLEEFTDWCRGSGVDPSLDMLRACSTAKSRRKS